MERKDFKILIIDDEEVLAEVLVESLELEDYQAQFKSSASDGLKYFKENNVELIICDMSMPSMSGLDLLKVIQEDSEISNKPFFFLYTGNVELTRQELQNLGGHEIISKPFDMDELVELIDTYRRRLN